ncbi:hypothetical protein PR202_gb23160 [Eleusine coracana subsp. coracana]|uniref:SKP1-like protein n=1 Tax=Eleusine coracana subsp. coracana TaxID=191504 RepID=A0AAV5FHJ2_ELECO|nr:hypothetical protein PR202_gb23160 [Eleusine coracana subsp. coracana]
MANAKVEVAAAEVTEKGKEKMLTLIGSDGEAFEVEESVAMESQTIKHMIEDDCAADAIPLPNVSSKILAKVIEFCRKHVQARATEAEDGEASSEPKKASADELKTYDAEFVKVDQAILFDLILVHSLVSGDVTFEVIVKAANYLDIKLLLDLTCQTVADMIKGKTPEEIRSTFNIRNDFTPEEEAEVRRENQWAFE